MLYLHLKWKLKNHCLCFKKKMIVPDQRNCEIIHLFGAFVDIQCERKLTEMLSGHLTADVDYNPVPQRANSTKFLTRTPTVRFRLLRKELAHKNPKYAKSLTDN